MAFVLDVNLRIQEILGLQKAEAALSKIKGTAQVGATTGSIGTTAGGTAAAAAGLKAQAAAISANTAAINKLVAANNKLATSQTKAATTTRKASGSMRDGEKAAKTFGDSVFLAGKRYAAFIAATAVPFAALGGISKATQSVIEFDAAMLKVRQITGETEQQMEGIRNTILDLATSTGTSATELARVGKVLSQAGFRGDELTESLTTLSKVPLTPSFETMDAAIEGTIAALNQFNSEGLTTANVLDVMTALANKFAASSEDIARGVARGGAAFEAIGGTFQEFAAIFTTIRQATRESAETVGTFMKTISSRLADPKIVNFLEGKGIRIAEAIEAGDPVEAFKRIAAGMQNIASVQDRIEIGTRLGGRRQISRLLALISNIDVLDDALKTAASSSGEFGKIAEVGLEGLQAQLNILVQEFNKLVQTLAEPLFVPIIRGATTAGKAFVSFLDFIKPVIPALTTIIGFAAGFKLLAISIGLASKAMASFSASSVGGGISGLFSTLGGVGGGGLAGVTARQRIQQRLAGGVGIGAGQATVAASAGAGAARLGRGALTAATSPVGQLLGFTIASAALDSFANKAEEAGNSVGVLTLEFGKVVTGLAALTVLLSGQGIKGAFSGVVAALGPWGAAIAAATVALGAFIYASKQAVDVDVQNIIDSAAQKVSEIEIEPIKIGGLEELQRAVGELGLISITEGIQESADRYEEGLSGFFASAYERVRNLFRGEGLITISDTQAQQMIEDIIGSNPELLNDVIRSAIEQFGATGLEAGLDQLISESLGGNAEAAARVRQAMITHAGGMEKIAKNIEQIKLEAKTSKLANAIEKASRDFEKLYIPSELSHQLGLLSDSVGNAARAIETNVTVFDQLSQVVGQDIGVARPGTEFTRESVEQIVRAGDIGGFIDLSQLPELEGFTTDMARVGQALDDFMRSIIQSRSDAYALGTALADPKIDPFDILSDYIDKFISEYPERIPPEAEAAFKAAAANLGQQLKNMLVEQAGVLPDTEEVQRSFEAVLGRQQPFYEAAVDVFKTWLDAQAQQINLAISAEELRAGVDIGTAELSETVIESLQNALSSVGIELQFPSNFESGLVDVNDVLIDLAQNGDIVGRVLQQYESSYNRHAELNRQVAEAQRTGEGASLDLLNASKNAAIEVLNLQVALTQLSKIAQRAPQALAEQQEEQRRLPYAFDEDAARRVAEDLEKSSQEISEIIARQRQFIEVQAAIDVSQAFEEPADIFAQALRESAAAVKSFTSALTITDLEKGLRPLTRPSDQRAEVRLITESQEAQQQRAVETRTLQSALFGGDIGNVMEALLQSAVETASTTAARQMEVYDYERGEANKAFARTLKDFSGLIYDIPRLIQESGLDTEEIARGAAEILREQAAEPGVREVEYIGALRRTVGDLTTSLQSLIERPELARQPETLVPQLTNELQNYLQRLAPPTERIPESKTAPRIFENLSSSATDIQKAALETRTAADITSTSVDEMKLASSDMRTGGFDILSASQNMIDAANKMQPIIDVQREVLAGQQGDIIGDGGGTGTREAITATTEAVNSLGERVDSVAKAIEEQTQQEVELATAEREKSLDIEGLGKNTDAINSSNEVHGRTQESISNLNEGMTKIAGAMENGVGIDIETMSQITVDVQGVAAAARELTPEFEAVAQRVVKEELRAVLQQLARSAGNSEAASTFESAIS